MQSQKDQQDSLVSTPVSLCLQTVKETVHLLSGKWKIQIIAFLLENGRTRFMEIQRGVAGISCKVLSQELQQMEKDGIIVRMASDAKLTIVEYELTGHGCELKSLLLCITSWGVEHAKIVTTN